MTNDREHPADRDGAIRRALEAAILAGDRDAAAEVLRSTDTKLAAEWKDALLSRLTGDCLDGRIPFSQLTAAAQAACLFPVDPAAPVACCGAIAGNTSPTGRDYMMMLLRAWGVPAIDLGVDVPEETFLNAALEHGLRFMICAVFTRADFRRVRRLDERARTLGVRDRFKLLIAGAQAEHGEATDLPSDYPDHRAAAVAEWVVRTWKA